MTTMRHSERNAKIKRPRSSPQEHLVKMNRIDLHLELSPTSARTLLVSLKPCLDDGGIAQIKFGTRDLKSIYVYAGPRQMKRFVARLEEVAR